VRQHIRSDARIHGIITDGGEAANVVPAHAAGSFLVRAADEVYLNELARRVLNCFQAAALATGARLQHKWAEVRYAPFRINSALADLYTANMEALGRKLRSRRPGVMLGSIDMGNVSMVVPSLHAMVAIGPKELLLHTPEFAKAASSPAAHQGLVDGAKALSMTALDLLMSPEALARVQEEFLSSSVAPMHA
jgi:metal-dependent amidase/aminoacylase/carboxypeptidase family protein